jgi:DNA-binding transcriptional LysR family regulator
MRGSNYAELQAFVAIAERGSFVRAAEELQVTPSALSQTLRSLEERMGVRLFNRTTRSVSLTIAGEHLLERLKPALQEVANAVENACLFGEKPSGRLRIHALRLASRMFLEPIFQPFAEAYPDIELDVVLDDKPVDIVADGFDATLRLGELIEQDMVGIKLGPQLKQIPAASPEYVARFGQPETPKDLEKHRCINWRWPGQIHPYRWEFYHEGEWFSVAVKGPLIVNDQRVAIEAAMNGVGIAFWLEDQMMPFIEAGKLVPLLEEWCAPFDGFYLSYPRQRQQLASLRAFIDFLKQNLLQQP